MPEKDFRPVLDLVCSECAASILVGPRPIDIRAATLTRQRDALAAACRVALDWLGDCDAGTQQAEIAEGLRAALAEVEAKP